MKRILAIIGLIIICLCFGLLIFSLTTGNGIMIKGMIMTVIFVPAFVWLLFMLNRLGKFLMKSNDDKIKAIDDYFKRLKEK